MQTQHPFAKGRRSFINILYATLLSTLVIGSSSQITSVQAAPLQEVITWYMDVASPKTLVCAGKTVEYKATARVNYNSGEAQWAIPGVKIEATSSNTGVGNFKKDTAIAGFANEDLITASFLFTGKKAGKTNLYFEALIDKKSTNTYISFTVPVTVINCKYKVRIVSKWMAGMTSVATMDGEITSDENGYFSGAATVNWATSKLCEIMSPIAPSQADLTGTLNDSGQLVMQITFGPISSLGGGNCGQNISTSNFGTPDPLSITVPASGGVFRKAQLITVTNGSFPGSAMIVAIPEEDAK